MFGFIFTNNQDAGYLLSKINDSKKSDINGINTYLCQMNNKDFIIGSTGSCKVNVGRSIKSIIDSYDIDGIIYIGVASSIYSNFLTIGNIALCSSSSQIDIDLSSLGYKIGEIPNLPENSFNCDESLVKKALDACRLCNYTAKVAKFLSSETFYVDSKEAVSYSIAFDGKVIDNETAAIGQVCYIDNIPYTSISTIITFADTYAVTNYKKYYDEGIKVASNVAYNMISLI